MIRIFPVLLFMFIMTGTLLAAVEPMHFDTAEQEHRYQELMKELRCLVCQNQSLAESNAGLAGDLRQITHEMILQGKDDAEIVEFLVSRYGDFVLYRPPVKESTYLLWYGPIILFLLAIVAVTIYIRRRTQTAESNLDAGDKSRLEQLLKQPAAETGRDTGQKPGGKQ